MVSLPSNDGTSLTHALTALRAQVDAVKLIWRMLRTTASAMCRHLWNSACHLR